MMNSPEAERMTFGQLLERLQQNSGNAPMPDRALLEQELHKNDQRDYPMVVRILIMLGSWIGAFLMAAFLTLFVFGNDKPTLLVAGPLFIIAALLLPRLCLLPIAIEPFALAMSIIGISMLMGGLEYHFDRRGELHNLLIAIIEMVIAVFTVSRVQRAAGIFAFFTFLGLYFYNNLESPYAVMVLISVCALLLTWMHAQELRLVSGNRELGRFYQPVLTGLIMALPGLCFYTIIKDPEGYESWRPNSHFTGWWPVAVPLVAALLWMLRIILRTTCGFARTRVNALLLLALLCLAPMVKAPGILAALLLITCGFYSGQKAGWGIGVVALVFYCIAFYYMMETSLIVKSVLMMVSGLLLISAALVFHFLSKRI